MVNNVFSLTPVEAVAERRKERSIFDKKDAATPPTPKPLNEISGVTGVPLNVVEAFTEAVTATGEIADPAQASMIAETFSAQLGEKLKSGTDMRAAMKDLLQDDADVVLNRALDIAKARAPEAPEDGNTSWSEREGNFFTDMYSGAMGSIGAGAKAFGADETAKYFSDIAERNAPPVQSYKDVDNFGEAVRYVSGGIAQSIPEMAAVAGAALATVLTGGGTAVAAGAALGTSTLFNAGRAADRQEEEVGEIDYIRAWGAGVAMGSLDAILPGAVGKGVGKAFSKRAAGAAVESASKRGIGAAALKGAATEAPTEVAQQLIEIGQANPDLLRVIVDPKPEELEKSDQLLTELVDSALIGGLAGGTFSGAGRAAENLAGGRDDEQAPASDADSGMLPPPDDGPAPEGMGAEAPAAPEPSGPLGRAAQAGGAEGLAPLDTGAIPGAKVRVTTPDGVDLEAEFVEETPDGITLKAEGGPMLVTRAQIESGEIAVQMRDPITQQREERQAQRAQIQADAEDFYITAPDEDISTPAERVDTIMGAIDRALMAAGNPTVTQAERLALYTRLDENGGSVDDAMWSMLEKEIDEEWDTDGQQDQGAAPQPERDEQGPEAEDRTGDAGAGAGNLEQPAGRLAIEGPRGQADEDAGLAGKPGPVADATGAFTKSDGKPFGDQKAAARFMRSNEFDQSKYEIAARDGGFVVAPKAAQDETDETAQPGPGEQKLQIGTTKRPDGGWPVTIHEDRGVRIAQWGVDEDQPRPDGSMMEFHRIRVAIDPNEPFGPAAHILATVSRNGDTLRIEKIQANDTNPQAKDFNSLGPKVLRRVLDAYADLMPDVKFLSGDRVGGARQDGDLRMSDDGKGVKIPIRSRKAIAAAKSDTSDTGTTITGDEGGDTPAPPPSIENIRTKAAVLRGVPEGEAPEVQGVSLKWDAKEGGYIFSRKHADKVRDAMGMDKAESPSASVDESAPEVDESTTAADTSAGKVDDTAGQGAADAAAADSFKSMAEVAAYIESNAPAGYMLQISGANTPAILRDPDLNEIRRYPGIPQKADVDRHIAALGSGAVDTAAAEADPNPSEAQAEAGNYKKGHVNFQGLDVTIENARDSQRKGKDADGKEWSVTMPAHYGYIKRTEGADGEHVDVYLGPDEESDSVTIIDQKDLGTETFDEHKVVLGAANNREARMLYRKGFSDGKGSQRIMGATTMTMAEFKEWLANGDLTKPAAKVIGKDSASTSPTTKRGEKIEDFGEKIGGARKDKAGRFIAELGADIDAATMTLSTAFPVPDYAALAARGLPMEALAGVAAIRGAIPRKPSGRRTWRLRDWGEDVQAARALAAGLMDGTLTVADIDAGEARTHRQGKALADTMKVFAGLPVDMLQEASSGFEVRPVYQSSTSQRPGEERAVAYYQVRRQSKYRSLFDTDTLEGSTQSLIEVIKADRAAKAGTTRGAGRKPVDLKIYKNRQTGKRSIGFKVSGVVELVGGFDSNNEARAYLDENRDALQAQADTIRDGLNERRDENRERKGPSRRDGDVTPEAFGDAFGFKGVEFGNWNNTRERQDSLNRAYDALMDLAGALDIPTKAISLNGTLSLAFGARGTGGRNPAAAHYEQGYKVMNLTKKNGAGSLAHEWFHAIDNYLAVENAKKGGPAAVPTGKTATRTEFMSDRVSKPHPKDDVAIAFGAFHDAINGNHEWMKRAKRADDARSTPYFSTTIEMAARGFERYVVDNLTMRGMQNDYLANVDFSSGAYPTSRELRRDGVLDALDGVADAMRDVLPKQGGKADMPDADPNLLHNGPDAGETWETPEGVWRIVERDTDTYTIQTPTGATEIYESAEAVDTLIADTRSNGEKAKAEAQAAREEAREKAREYEERAKEIGTRYSRDTGNSLSNLDSGYRFPEGYYSRKAMVVKLVEDGWRVKGDPKSKTSNFYGPKGSGYGRNTWTIQGLQFAEWYGNLKDLEARREAAQAAQEPQGEDAAAPEDMDAQIDAALESALDNAFKSEDKPKGEGATPRDSKQDSPAKDTRSAAQAAKDARENIGKGADAAMDGLMKLFGGKNTLNSGFTFSKETYDLAKPLFKEAMSKFADAGKDITQMAVALVNGLKDMGMTREQVSDMMPYLKRYIAEEQGADQNPIKNDEPVKTGEGEENTRLQQDPIKNDAYATVRDAVRTHLEDGGAYGDIRSLRKQAAEALGRPLEKLEHKAVEEAAEEAIVGIARDIVASDATDAQKYDQLVQLYERQPLLAEKTSTSVENQAYSTPAPLAFIASRLAGITSETRVTEPSAGTGMLLIGADPALVRANEKNPDRVAALRRNLPGALVTQGDATTQTYAPYDVLITNPPFGTVKVGGVEQKWPMAKTQTKEIDHAIAWRALEAMPEDGSAVLILGGVNPRKYEGEARSKGYMGNGKRQFFANLYERFNVVDHFTAAGSLYKRQGAAWPVDVVVIRGRGQSALPLPMAQAPAMIETWADMKGKLDVADSLGTTEQQPGVGRPDPAEDAGSGRNDADGLQGSVANEAGQPDRVDGPSGTAGSGRGDGRAPGDDAAGTGGAPSGPRGNADTGQAGDGTRAGSGTGSVSGGRATDRVSGRPAQQPVERENTEAETDLQVRYAPRSNAQFAVGTLVPVNMRDAITKALDAIEAKHGSVDQFVADALGYSLEELLGTDSKPGYFSAEQVDALAMAIDNVDRGKGFIIGDQTGVGKGRFVAAMLRFAERKGRIPVFVTKAPGLYGDMIRDLRDIGDKDAHKGVLVTNSNLRGAKAIPLTAKASDILEAKAKKALDSAIAGMKNNGKLPKGSRFLFTTYSQMQTVASKEPARRDALRGIAPHAMFIFDESHEAGGGTAETRKKKGAPPSRAEFVREIVTAANGTVFSSATYAKNPDVMSLYSSTDLSLAVTDLSKLGDAIKQGGVPLQQVTAGALTEAGQYARRERSWDGVPMDIKPVPIDKPQAERVTEVIASIFETDVVFMSDARRAATEALKKQGYANLPGGRAVDVESADDTGFSSVLHNVVGQMLLSLKVDQVAERAIAAHKAGEKPVIAVVNTNGALLQAVIESEGLETGDMVSVPFSTILHRYVDRLRRITVKDKDDKSFHIELTDDQLGPMAVRELRNLHAKIDATDMAAMSAAPLDQLKDRLTDAGIKVGEITGRNRIIKKGKLAVRDNSESAKKREMLAFNAGDLDSLLINQAGSTGYSLHAVKGAEGNDGKPRRMLVLQPDPNIDTFMQMLGRIHRTGQTSLPAYDILVSDLAIEKRVAAILMRKMASLSANTTASKDSAISFDSVTDFLNEVGDRVVKNYLEDNGDIASRLDLDPSAEGIANKMTGRLALMAPDETQRVYDEVEQLYRDEIERLDAIGENPLTAQVVDWQAKQVSTSTVAEGGGTGSPLDADTVVEELSVKRIGKPYTLEKVEELVSKNAGDLDAAIAKASEMEPVAIASMEARLVELEKALVSAEETKDTAPKRAQKAAGDVNRQRENIRSFKTQMNDLRQELRDFRVGANFSLGLGSSNLPAKVIGIDSSKVDGNPLARSKYRIRFAVADAMREVSLPLSKIGTTADQVPVTASSEPMVQSAFMDGQTITRETRQVVTGNLINAFAMFKKGQVTLFTMEDGTKRSGVALPKGFDANKHIEDLPVAFSSTDQIMTFLESVGAAQVIDSNSDRKSPKLEIVTSGNGYVMKARKAAKEFFSGETIKGITGEWQTRSGGVLQVYVMPNELREALDYYQSELGTTFKTETNKEAARLATGQELPKVESGEAPKAARRSAAPAPKSAADLRRGLISAANSVNREIRKALGDRVKLRLAPGAFDFGKGYDNLDGYFVDGTIGIALDASDPLGVARHEVIHALRDPKVFGGTHGAFTKAEWQTLVRAARKAKDIRARIDAEYSDLSETARNEEAVAELYRQWAAGRDAGMDEGTKGALATLGRVLDAIINALRGNGLQTAADVFERVRSGETGGRGPQGPSGGGDLKASKRWTDSIPFVSDSNLSRGRKKLVGNILTQAMAGKDSGRVSLLASVPGRALISELGKRLGGAQRYLDLKQKMDTLRNDRHARTDEIAQEWRKLISGDKIWKKGDKASNTAMMDLMHESSIAGVDPSKPFVPVAEPRDEDIVRLYSEKTPTHQAAKGRLERDAERQVAYDALKARYKALPKRFQDMFQTVRDEYVKMADEFEAAIVEQAEKAMTLASRRADRDYQAELDRVRDEGLTGKERDEALAAADKAVKNAKARTMLSKQARLAQLRDRFESNRIEAPYFPLARFGDLFVTSRDSDGVIVSFSKFESAEEQRAEVERMKAEGYDVEFGVMDPQTRAQMVDPNFVADIEGLLEGIPADSQIMDEIWQRWLATLPDMSLRKSRMHRKGTPGYSGDAFRTFGKQMFHGAHQLARLKYSLEMSEALDIAQEEAKRADDPVRAGLVVREMQKRHEYVMNPEGSAWAQGLTSLAFVWYLGVTPAAAIVNITQTTVVGVPILGAAYGKGGVKKASAELMRAMGDFTTGKGHAAESSRLTADERAAMEEAYKRGVVDKSQSHDLAGVGETGVEYNDIRTKVMEKISFFFHHAERMNREVTFLAAYRMSKSKGMGHEEAITRAGDLTWKTHFDYQNTSRPRLMQNDFMRVALVFRNFQVNMLWRLFRDSHQMMQGKTPEERREAAAQLVGITGSMLLHAGVKGTWGYALTMGLLGLFFSGGGDEAEEALEQALLNYLPKDAAGIILNGAPGHLTGINLTSRIGMPELWFRASNRELSGEDEYNYWLQQVVGAVPGIAESIWRGADMASDGELWRGVETMTPKFIRDMMRSGRYWAEGAETYRGDPIIDRFKAPELLAQAVGFSPARLSERYDLNTRMKNREQRIVNERRDILADVRKAHRKGEGMPEGVLGQIVDFNTRYPTYPINGRTIKASIQGGIRSSQRNVQGVQINPRLDGVIREATREPIYE